MNNYNFPPIIVLGHALELYSITGSSSPENPNIVWTSKETWSASRGSRAWLLRCEIHEVANNVFIRIKGQWSIDGQAWHDFVGQVDGRGGTNTIDAVGSYSFQYAGLPEEHAEYVRFGIQVAVSSGTDRGRVKLSASITALPEVLPTGIGFVTGAISNGDVGATIVTAGYQSGNVVCKLGVAGGGSLMLYGSNNGVDFAPAVSGTGFDLASTTGETQTLAVLPMYLKLVASGITGSPSGSVSIALRPV